MANRLAGQTSPYLLQHADNPVDWWPWGPEALAEAMASRRPILLSIGYAACHWCHVMAHESFENPAVARLINAAFVPVKVDREERPDLDAIYQLALAAFNRHGGWPLTMFLTPKGEPFWGGTYFPPEARWGMPAFATILDNVARTWAQQPDAIASTTASLLGGLHRVTHSSAGPVPPLPALDAAARQMLPMVDFRHGGLGGAPKFPQAAVFDFLWRAFLRTGDEDLGRAVTLTLDAICQGGIYDHLGGGFMRYSTDAEWLVPHFEKMLYDNAQLVELLTLAWQRTGRPLYRQRVAETVGWVLREMIAEDGAFAATLDADSKGYMGSEGGEGAFYTWTAEEIGRLLEPGRTKAFAAAYDVTPLGNWEGRVILRRLDGGDGSDLAAERALLWHHRETRPRPGRDDKVLADWNGMMITALANAAFAFHQPGWLEAARTAYRAVRLGLAQPDGRLAHSKRLGQIGAAGLLDDLAWMIRAAVALAEVTGETAYVEDARAFAALADRHHWDGDAGGYFQAADDAPDLILRLKPVHDNAVPAANGVMAQALAKLGLLTGDEAYSRRAEATVAALAGELTEAPFHLVSLLTAAEILEAPVEITVAGKDPAALLDVVAATALPTRVLRRGTAEGTANAPATAVVCRRHSCLPPVADPVRLRELLNER